jgi:hypothetical protein
MPLEPEKLQSSVNAYPDETYEKTSQLSELQNIWPLGAQHLIKGYFFWRA